MNAVSTGSATHCNDAFATAFLRAVAELWRCALPVFAAGLLGGAIDEWHHSGVSSWISLCVARPLPLATAICFQTRLLTCSYLAMFGVAACQWILVAGPQSRLTNRSLLLGQSCCMMAMLLALLICPKILAAGSAGKADMLAMVCTDLLCAAAGVITGAAVLASVRQLRAPSRARAMA